MNQNVKKLNLKMNLKDNTAQKSKFPKVPQLNLGLASLTNNRKVSISTGLGSSTLTQRKLVNTEESKKLQ